MRYLVDTNAVSDLVRHPQGRVAQHIRKVGDAQICTSIIVAAELRYGAAKKDRHGSRLNWKRCSERLKFCPSRSLQTKPTARSVLGLTGWQANRRQ